MKRFLDEGGDVETIGGRFHSTLLTEACRFRAAKVIELLLDRGAAANVSGGGFWTPLHYACSVNSTAGAAAATLVAKLIENHAEVDATDFQGRTPLHTAAARGSAAVVLALLEAGTRTAKGAVEGGELCYVMNANFSIVHKWRFTHEFSRGPVVVALDLHLCTGKLLVKQSEYEPSKCVAIIAIFAQRFTHSLCT